MNWPFAKARNAKKGQPAPVREKDIPSDEERRGPVPPPPRTAHAPGVSVYRFDAIPSRHLLRLDDGCVGFFFEGEEGNRRSPALLVLTGPGVASPGDVLLWSPSLSLEEISRASPRPHRHIKRDDLGGRAVPGITGLRTLAELPEARLAVLRLGPPPTARWVFRGVRAIAVFSGKITLMDGEEARLVRAGSLALVGDPSATLYLEAGNDSALAVALAASGFVAALG